jgi:nitrite reductase/ring-hydroxylating ferredoxin subunit
VPDLGKQRFFVHYRGDRREAILVRCQGRVHGYLNECAHMPKPLDGEDSHVFDESGRYVQCSMHGICFDPCSGEPVNELCGGRKLTVLQVREEEGWIYLVDKKATLAA